MATYVIGDLQGCLRPLKQLLDKLHFEPRRDRLWFTGDLVNRGPDSLGVLRFVKGLGESALTVLGNHDLHLLAASLRGHASPKDSFQDVLAAKDRDELLHWLRQQPLIHHDAEYNTLMVHAGLPPQWDTATALRLADEAQTQLRGEQGDEFLTKHMYGDGPGFWKEELRGPERLRFIINACTRLRFVRPDGGLDLNTKGPPDKHPTLTPWFMAPNRGTETHTVLFGHWSQLGRIHWSKQRVWGLDSGCVWGGGLSALNLDTGKVLTEGCERQRKPGGSED